MSSSCSSYSEDFETMTEVGGHTFERSLPGSTPTHYPTPTNVNRTSPMHKVQMWSDVAAAGITSTSARSSRSPRNVNASPKANKNRENISIDNWMLKEDEEEPMSVIEIQNENNNSSDESERREKLAKERNFSPFQGERAVDKLKYWSGPKALSPVASNASGKSGVDKLKYWSGPGASSPVASNASGKSVQFRGEEMPARSFALPDGGKRKPDGEDAAIMVTSSNDRKPSLEAFRRIDAQASQPVSRSPVVCPSSHRPAEDPALTAAATSQSSHVVRPSAEAASTAPLIGVPALPPQHSSLSYPPCWPHFYAPNPSMLSTATPSLHMLHEWQQQHQHFAHTTPYYCAPIPTLLPSPAFSTTKPIVQARNLLKFKSKAVIGERSTGSTTAAPPLGGEKTKEEDNGGLVTDGLIQLLRQKAVEKKRPQKDVLREILSEVAWTCGSEDEGKQLARSYGISSKAALGQFRKMIHEILTSDSVLESTNQQFQDFTRTIRTRPFSPER